MSEGVVRPKNLPRRFWMVRQGSNPLMLRTQPVWGWRAYGAPEGNVGKCALETKIGGPPLLAFRGPPGQLQELQDNSRTSRNTSRTSRSTSRTTFRNVLSMFRNQHGPKTAKQQIWKFILRTPFQRPFEGLKRPWKSVPERGYWLSV